MKNLTKEPGSYCYIFVVEVQCCCASDRKEFLIYVISKEVIKNDCNGQKESVIRGKTYN